MARTLLAVALLLGTPGASSAQSASRSTEVDPASASVEELSKLSLEELLNLEIRAASKESQPISEAPSVASVVNRDAIRSYGWLSIQEVLSRQPGFYLGQEVERLTIGTRGAYENWANYHLALLIDGVAFNDPLYSSALTSELTPIFLVETLEVIRGPGSALYGSNAVNGVIAVNSIRAPRDGGTRAEAAVRIGTFGRQIHDVMTGVDRGLASMVLAFNFSRDAGSRYLSADLSGRTDGAGNPQLFPVQDQSASTYLFAKLEGKKALRGFSLQYHRQAWQAGSFLGAIFVAPDDSRDLISYERNVIALSYRTPGERVLRQEYVLQFQRMELNQRSRVLPNEALGGFYPGGVTESIDGTVDSLFARTQLAYRPMQSSFSLIGGAEFSSLYSVEQDRFLNVDLESRDPATGLPLPLAGPRRSGPALALQRGGAPKRLGLFAQASSGRIWRRAVEFTGGLRYDNASYKYRDLLEPGEPIRNRVNQQVSPRLSMVGFPSERLSLKLMAGRAFREPTPAETLIRNSFLGGGNPTLKPETVNSYEIGADWRPNHSVVARVNSYIQQFNNLIGYDLSNVVHNAFSRRTAGTELETQWVCSLGGLGSLDGFANYSVTRILSETANAAFLTAHPDRLTWAPVQTAKVGVNWRYQVIGLALQGVYQGRVLRRNSDQAVPEFNALRPTVVPPWTQFDATVSYQPWSWLTARVRLSDLLNTRGRLIGNQAMPLDYRLPGRRIMGFVEITL